jgi:hypothetical protein
LAVLLLLSACRGPATPQVPNDIGKDLTPKGATMVVTGRGDNPNVWERSFTVKSVYPALGLADDAFARLRSQGWKQCESTQDKWSSYVDRKREVPATVHQRTQYWNRANDVLMIVFSHRVADSDPEAGLVAQRVTLSFNGAQSAEDMERWNRAFGAGCS